MIMIFEYVRLFIKVAFSNKIGVVMTLILPILLILLRNNQWTSNQPPINNILLTIILWWGYIYSISILNGVGVNQLVLREQGFLKLFKFISGSTIPIFIGNLISQFLFTFVTISVFNIVVSLMFGISFFELFFASTVTLVVLILPLGFYASWIAYLPVKQETVTSLTALSVFPLLFFTTNAINIDKPFSFLLLLNHLVLAQQVSKYFLYVITYYHFYFCLTLYSYINMLLNIS